MKDADSTTPASQGPEDLDGVARTTSAVTKVRLRPVVWFALIAAITVLVDQITKFIAENSLASGESIEFLGDLFGLLIVYNLSVARCRVWAVGWCGSLVV